MCLVSPGGVNMYALVCMSLQQRACREREARVVWFLLGDSAGKAGVCVRRGFELFCGEMLTVCVCVSVCKRVRGSLVCLCVWEWKINPWVWE